MGARPGCTSSPVPTDRHPLRDDPGGGVIDGDASAPDYVDILEVSSVTADQEAAAGPDGDALAHEWLAMVSDYVILRGAAIASHPKSDEERR